MILIRLRYEPNALENNDKVQPAERFHRPSMSRKKKKSKCRRLCVKEHRRSDNDLAQKCYLYRSTRVPLRPTETFHTILHTDGAPHLRNM